MWDDGGMEGVGGSKRVGKGWWLILGWERDELIKER